MCLVLEREDGHATVFVDLAQLLDGKWWSVTWVGSDRDYGLGMSIRRSAVSMSLDRRGAASVDVTVGYGGQNVTKTFKGNEEVNFDLGFKPNTTGHFLILFKDQQGNVFDAQGATLPKGDFAAG
jgi:hypothetical protein